jgi:hypothetical protein
VRGAMVVCRATFAVALFAAARGAGGHVMPLQRGAAWTAPGSARGRGWPSSSSSTPSESRCTADWTLPSDPAVRACCKYAVVRQPVTQLRGAIPPYINGTFYHAVFVTNLTDDYPGPGTVGAVLSVDFSTSTGTGPGGGTAATTPTSSFRYNEGTKFMSLCNSSGPRDRFAPSNAVTITRVNGSRIVVATGVPDLNSIDAHTLAPLARPLGLTDAGGFPGPPQLSPPKHGHAAGPPGPSFYGPGHLPTDVNGDVYTPPAMHALLSTGARFD